MRKWFPVLFIAASLSSQLFGEIVIEFDGKEWKFPDGFADMTEEALQGGVCYVADANVPAGIALEGMGFDQLLAYPIRFALRGQEGNGAKIDPILPGKQEAESTVVILCEGGRVMAQIYPEEDAERIPNNAGRGIMDDDFIGLENFLTVIRKGVAKADAAGEIPRFALVLKSKTSFGQMVRLIQLVRSAGCLSGRVLVRDDPTGLKFDALSDRDVSLPVIEVPKAEPSGIIVLNVREDGTITFRENIILVDERDVMDFVSQERKRLEAAGFSARFQLRADGNAIFKYSRSLIRTAAEAGVEDACFAVYEVDPANQEGAEKWRLKEIPVTFSKPGEAFPAAVEIAISHEDAISIPDDAGELDKDAGTRDLPLLKAKLKAIASTKNLGQHELRVSVRIADRASQQRVTDVLNALAEIGASRVAIVDVAGE